MADYQVVVSKRAAGEIEDLPAGIAARVYAKLEALASEPRRRALKSCGAPPTATAFGLVIGASSTRLMTASAWSTWPPFVIAARLITDR